MKHSTTGVNTPEATEAHPAEGLRLHERPVVSRADRQIVDMTYMAESFGSQGVCRHITRCMKAV